MRRLFSNFSLQKFCRFFILSKISQEKFFFWKTILFHSIIPLFPNLALLIRSRFKFWRAYRTLVLISHVNSKPIICGFFSHVRFFFHALLFRSFCVQYLTNLAVVVVVSSGRECQAICLFAAVHLHLESGVGWFAAGCLLKIFALAGWLPILTIGSILWQDLVPDTAPMHVCDKRRRRTILQGWQPEMEKYGARPWHWIGNVIGRFDTFSEKMTMRERWLLGSHRWIDVTNLHFKRGNYRHLLTNLRTTSLF